MSTHFRQSVAPPWIVALPLLFAACCGGSLPQLFAWVERIAQPRQLGNRVNSAIAATRCSSSPTASDASRSRYQASLDSLHTASSRRGRRARRCTPAQTAAQPIARWPRVPPHMAPRGPRRAIVRALVGCVRPRRPRQRASVVHGYRWRSIGLSPNLGSGAASAVEDCSSWKSEAASGLALAVE